MVQSILVIIRIRYCFLSPGSLSFYIDIKCASGIYENCIYSMFGFGDKEMVIFTIKTLENLCPELTKHLISYSRSNFPVNF
jgi:hypothetical protein